MNDGTLVKPENVEIKNQSRNIINYDTKIYHSKNRESIATGAVR